MLRSPLETQYVLRSRFLLFDLSLTSDLFQQYLPYPAGYRHIFLLGSIFDLLLLRLCKPDVYNLVLRHPVSSTSSLTIPLYCTTVTGIMQVVVWGHGYCPWRQGFKGRKHRVCARAGRMMRSRWMRGKSTREKGKKWESCARGYLFPISPSPLLVATKGGLCAAAVSPHASRSARATTPTAAPFPGLATLATLIYPAPIIAPYRRLQPRFGARNARIRQHRRDRCAVATTDAYTTPPLAIVKGFERLTSQNPAFWATNRIFP